MTTPITRPAAAAEPIANAASVRPAIWIRGLLAGAGATVVSLLAWLVGSAAGASMVVDQGGALMTIGLAIAGVASFAPLALAGVVTWLLAKRWPAARIVLAWAGLVLAVASAAAPFAVAADTPTAVSFAVMHAGAGIAWFIGMRAGVRG